MYLWLFNSSFYYVTVGHFVGVVNFRSLLITVGLGQTLSLLICGTAVASGLLQIEHVLVPTGRYSMLDYYNSLLHYFLLSIL